LTWELYVAWAIWNWYLSSCHTFWRILRLTLYRHLWSTSWAHLVSLATWHRHCPQQIFNFCGFHKNECLMFSTCSSFTGLPVLSPLQTQPSLTKCFYKPKIDSLLNGTPLYVCWICHCNVTTDFVSWKANIWRVFSGLGAILQYSSMQLPLVTRMNTTLRIRRWSVNFRVYFLNWDIVQLYLKKPSE
jgi:hypothetical protein